MMNISRNGFPFTASQWQELEHQVLIFKYMVSGIPVPPDLLYSISRSLESSLSSKLLLHQPHHIGWNCLQMGFGRKIDPEPGRCRRTDGKKWRCSKEAYPDSKYCDRHMHRGRNRSRKPVEVFTTSSSITSQSTSTGTPTTIPFSSITKNTSPSPSSPTSLSFSSLTSLGSESHPQNHSLQHPFNQYYHCSGGSPKSHFSSEDHITKIPSLMLESNAYSYVQRTKMKVEELPFFSETSGTMKSRVSEASFHESWQPESLAMGSPGSNMKQSSFAPESSYSSRSLKQHHYNGMDSDVKNHIPLQFMERECENKNVMHHFFDELPPKERNLWHENDDKLSSHAPSSKVQLSISIPTSSHDFFLARKSGE